MNGMLARYAARDARVRARQNNARIEEVKPLIETAVKEKNEEIAALKERIAALEAENTALKGAEGGKTPDNAPVGDSTEPTTQTPTSTPEAAEGGKKAVQGKGKGK